jgi:ATP-dependent RNA helicase DeaD
VAALEFDHFLKYYENAEDLNAKGAGRRERFDGADRSGSHSDRGDRNERFSRGDTGFTKLFINLGTKDGFYKASFLQFVLDESNLSKEVLGKIDMRDMNTWVEVDNANAQQMIGALDGKKYNNRVVRMNEADGAGSSMRKPGGRSDRRDGGGDRRESGDRSNRGSRPVGAGGDRDRKRTYGAKRK